MKLPRDISGDELIKILQRLGYQPSRQTGSHVRMSFTMTDQEVHHVTVPRHKNLRMGTLNAILQDVAGHLGLDKQKILKKR